MAGLKRVAALPWPVPEPVPPDPSTLDTRALLAVLQQLKSQPRPVAHFRHWPLAIRSVADYVSLAPGWMAHWLGTVNRYPAPFQKVEFDSEDGTTLSGWLGFHTPEEPKKRRHRKASSAERREGILVVPGMFSSKDNWIQKARALTIFRDWGYHVFAMDLRGFGESKRVFNTAGWKESEDVAAAVKEFQRQVPLHKLHIYAESLGASAALLAAAREARAGRKLIDGGLLAVGPYADARKQVEHISGRGVRNPDFYMVQWFFIRLLRLGGGRHRDFLHYMRDAARHYGVSVPELYERSSPKHAVRDINIPTLILESEDDPVVPSYHADEFERLLANVANPALWRLPWGSHCLYEMLDPDWFWGVLREFFDFYCLLPKRV